MDNGSGHPWLILSLVKKKFTNLSFLFPVLFCSCCFSVFVPQSFFFSPQYPPHLVAFLEHFIFVWRGPPFYLPILLLSLFLSGLVFIGSHFVATVSAHISPMGMLTLCCPSSSSVAGREGQPHCCTQSPSNFHSWRSCMWKEEPWLLFLRSQKESCRSPLGFVRHHPSRAAATWVNRSRVLCLAFPGTGGRGTTQFLLRFDERQVLSGSCLCKKCSLNIWQRKQAFFDT